MQTLWHVVDFTHSQIVAGKDTNLIRAFADCLKLAKSAQGMTLWSYKHRCFIRTQRRTTFMVSPKVVEQAPSIIQTFSFYPESFANLHFEDWSLEMGTTGEEEPIQQRTTTQKPL